MNWRNEKTTEFQRSIITKMCNILSWRISIPKTKGEAYDLIKEMLSEARKRIRHNGTMYLNFNA